MARRTGRDRTAAGSDGGGRVRTSGPAVRTVHDGCCNRLVAAKFRPIQKARYLVAHASCWV
jgi:hypothetical protein